MQAAPSGARQNGYFLIFILDKPSPFLYDIDKGG